MKDLRYDRKLWEPVREMNLNPDSNGEVWGTLYRYPIWAEVPAGAEVEDGWGQKHTAPSSHGTYTLYQYVQDGTLIGFRWVKDG